MPKVTRPAGRDLPLHRRLIPLALTPSRSWCNVYTRDNVLCSSCDCDNTVISSDGNDKGSEHCSGAGGVWAPKAEDVLLPPLPAAEAAAAPEKKKAPTIAERKSDPTCETWCNIYSRDTPQCAGCDCDSIVLISDGNDKPSEHCDGAGGYWEPSHLLSPVPDAPVEAATPPDHIELHEAATTAAQQPAFGTLIAHAPAAQQPTIAAAGTAGSMSVWDGKGAVPSFNGHGKTSVTAAAVGPIPQAGYPNAGWVVDGGGAYEASQGALSISGNARTFLVQDTEVTTWAKHRYLRLDLSSSPLRFTLDLSNVPCGCLACGTRSRTEAPLALGNPWLLMSNSPGP